MHLFTKLFSDTKGLNQITILADIFLLQIIKETSSLADKLQQPLTGMMIFLVDLKMIGQVGDSIGNKCNLHL